MRLTIDMETRSCVDLKKCGMYVYAEDSSTDVLCIAVKIEDLKCGLWLGEITKKAFRVITSEISKEIVRGLEVPTLAGISIITDDRLIQLIEEATEIHAHNAGFERCMWRGVMQGKYNFPSIDFMKWRCTAAKAAVHALPRSLDGAGKALDVGHKKDNVGYRVMMKMCKPRKALKADKEKYPDWKERIFWHESPDDFLTLCQYCVRDVDSEYDIDQELYDLSPEELETWRLDQIINDRGIKVDLDAIDNLMYKVAYKEKKLLRQIQVLTCGMVNSPRQVAEARKWLATKGLMLPDLRKATVEGVLTRDDLDPKVRTFLEIRQSLSKSSVAKLEAMKCMACKDGRVRGILLYHGATTGRWAGRGIQPQNFPRNTFKDDVIDNLLDTGVVEAEKEHGCIIQSASKCLRGMITCENDTRLICADFSAIEARVLAWFAHEVKVLEAFRQGLDLYKVAATGIYNMNYEAIGDKSSERQVGKVAVLALGYQGWIGAFLSMAVNYGVELPEEQVKEIILKWREAHPYIVEFWAGVERAAIAAVKTGKPYSYGRVKFGIRGRFLHCRLPNGRLLSYCDPSIDIIDTKYKQAKEVVSFMGMCSYTNKWKRQYTYGGKLTENIVQAASRDLLRDAMLRLEKEGYPIVLHVHDEAVAEVVPFNADLEHFENVMAEVPAWAEGLPIGAEGWVGKRYRK